ncbi:class I SAM-dependent methyltransferase [Thauera aminoaromatica]|uniref:SAM-dependent methyltransferase n=1 Tax=Thauera aminoaromatica TaxID=164330 RepID=A0A5C7S6U6_THASP|nr:class I SAM-dependent methyltransferase [Thauera aminoaromatica]TXH78381.1 MAG: SAM-dependent methyltransferase [Thauera aminoaromatica]
MTTLQAQHTFAQRSDAYAQARPRYPRELIDWLLANTADRDAAWDCATGNGQAAVDLAPYFNVVLASDISAEQIGEGLARPNISYSVQPAEQTGFADNTFDLITVAQALHWFDFARFWREVSRVAKPGALFCAWGYAWFECDPDVDATLVQPVRELIGPYWAANNRILWRGYPDEDIEFPYSRLVPPALTIRAQWSVPQLIDYMQTWSAYKRALQSGDVARELNWVIKAARQHFAQRAPLQITMPLSVVAGHVIKG